MKNNVNIAVPTGALGSGVDEQQLFAAILTGKVDAIACDAGSTDSGPYYLASGRCKYSRASVKKDLDILMRAQAMAKVPLLIGSCGTSGSDAALDWTYEIAREIATERGLEPRIALLYSEQSAELMQGRARQGKILPLPPMTQSNAETIGECEHIVALMGPEPYIAALQAGAEIVLGGRSTDAGVLAAVPLMHGMDPGPSWHAGKIAECGGICTVNARDGGVLIQVDPDGFEIEPLSPCNSCTPESVSAHLLYENTEPYYLPEPGGVLDVSHVSYTALSPRRVRASGARFVARPYTMKLEGASTAGFQTIMMVGIQEPQVLKSLPRFLSQMRAIMVERVQSTFGASAGDFDISLRPYGWNAVCGTEPPEGTSPREIGLLFVVTAASQDLATQIAKTCNPVLFHMPLSLDAPLPSYAFPFSPAEIERGAVSEFRLNHVVEVDHPLELVQIVHISAEDQSK